MTDRVRHFRTRPVGRLKSESSIWQAARGTGPFQRDPRAKRGESIRTARGGMRIALAGAGVALLTACSSAAAGRGRAVVPTSLDPPTPTSTTASPSAVTTTPTPRPSPTPRKNPNHVRRASCRGAAERSSRAIGWSRITERRAFRSSGCSAPPTRTRSRPRYPPGPRSMRPRDAWAAGVRIDHHHGAAVQRTSHCAQAPFRRRQFRPISTRPTGTG